MLVPTLQYRNWQLFFFFKADREIVDDNPRSGRPSNSVEIFIMEDRRVAVRHIAAEMSMSVGSVETTLHDGLNMFKASTR